MTVYLIPFLITLFGSIKYDISKAKGGGKKFLWAFLYVYLTLLIGLRYMVGGDTFFYHVYFDQLSLDNLFSLGANDDYQPFFVQSMLLAKAVYPKFVSFQILHVVIINSILFWYIKQNSKYIFSVLFFCLLIFYINFTVEILRESMAVMVFVLNYKNLEEKKWVKYFIGVFIASMFHLSAVYLLVLPFLQFLRLNYFYMLLTVLFTVVLTQIQSFLSLLGSVQAIGEKIGFYANASSSLNTTLLFLFAKFVIPIGFFTYAKNVLKQNIRYESLMCTFGLIGIGTVFNTLIFMRLSNYLLLFYCLSVCDILIPYLRAQRANFNQLVMFIMVFSSVLIIGYVSFFWPTGYYIKWVPYMSIYHPRAQNEELIYRE